MQMLTMPVSKSKVEILQRTAQCKGLNCTESFTATKHACTQHKTLQSWLIMQSLTTKLLNFGHILPSDTFPYCSVYKADLELLPQVLLQQHLCKPVRNPRFAGSRLFIFVLSIGGNVWWNLPCATLHYSTQFNILFYWFSQDQRELPYLISLFNLILYELDTAK